MPAHNGTIAWERASLLARFRREPVGLVYSRAPGGEGRLISEEEAVALLVEFDLMSHVHARRFSYSVWIAVIGFPLFIGAGMTLTPLFGLAALVSFVGWFIVALVQRLQRVRFVSRIWSRLDRNPPARALSRSEKLARGFTIPWWQTALILLTVGPFALFVQAPKNALPQPWREWQTIAIAFVFVAVIVILAVHGVRWLLHGTTDRPSGRR